MLDALKKKLAGVSQAQTEKESAVMADKSVEMSLSTQLKDALDQMEQLNSALAVKEASLLELSGKLAQYEELAKEAEAKAEAMRQEAQAKELADRKEALAAVIGADNAKFDAIFEPLKNLDAASFSVIVESFQAANEKIAESPMFKEVGHDAEADSSKMGESSLMQHIKNTIKKENE